MGSLPKVHIININLLQYSLHTPSPTHTLQAILRQVLKSQPTGIQSLSLPPRFQDSQIDRRPARLHTPLSIDSITSSGPSVHSCISIYMTRAPTSYPPPPSSTLNFFSPPTMLVLHPHHPHYNIGNEQQPPFYQAGLPHRSHSQDHYAQAQHQHQHQHQDHSHQHKAQRARSMPHRVYAEPALTRATSVASTASSATSNTSVSYPATHRWSRPSRLPAKAQMAPRTRSLARSSTTPSAKYGPGCRRHPTHTL